MTFEEEEFLKQFEERTKKGELASANEIKQEYIKLVAHNIRHEEIYRVLRRHDYIKIMPRSRHPRKAGDEEIGQSKKIANLVQKTKRGNASRTVRSMFEDEASFGRINKPKYCCLDPVSPAIKEVQVCFWLGGVFNGGKIFLVMPNCNTDNMNAFLRELSKSYNENIVIPVCYGAAGRNQRI